jgi:histidinol-phosphate aminotransferase
MDKSTIDITQWVRPNILRLKPYSSARSEFKGQADIFLDANENPFDTGMNRYPDPLQWAVKEELGKLKEIDPRHIFLGNGSDEVIDLLIRIFCEPGQDAILTLPPTYGMYQVSAGIADVAVREVPLTPDYQPDVEQVLAAADQQTKLLFLCSPNNPTGNNLDLLAMERLVAEFSGVVVVDEAYIDFSDQDSCIKLLPKYPNLVVMQTFSKAWGMAGIRLGMAFASEEIIALFNKVKPPYNVNQLTQKAALDALLSDHSLTEMVEVILEQRDRLEQRLPDLPFVQRVYPSHANFLLVKVDAPKRLYDYLVEDKIIVRDRSNVLLCDGALRITVGRPEENDQLLDSLIAYASF